MKKILLPVAALLFVVPTLKLNAQDVDMNDIKFEYIQLPTKPLKKDIKNYQSKVVLKYMDDINASKGSFADRVKKAEDDYSKAMDNYYVQQKLADDQYNTEMDAWNKKSLAEKLLMEKNKPQKKYVPVPYKQLPVEQKYQKSFDTEMLSAKFFKLEGYTNNPTNCVTITVKLLGFDNAEPELKTTQTSTAGPNKTSVTVNKYSYVFKYKHPVGYRVETQADGLIYEDFPVEMTNYTVTNSAEYNSQSELQSWWNNAKDGYLNKLQEDIVNKNLAAVGVIINNMFGYRKISYATELGQVDEKKDYDDTKEAYTAAVAGYNALITDQTKAAAIPNITKAVDIWEKCMKESNLDSKKARIDRGVTKMLLVNLQEAYIWLDNYEKSQACFDKLMALDPDKSNRHRAERLREMAKDSKERWLANKQ